MSADTKFVPYTSVRPYQTVIPNRTEPYQVEQDGYGANRTESN